MEAQVSSEKNMSAIERALAAAKARKAAGGGTSEASQEAAPARPKPAAEKISAEERAARKAQLASDRAARRAEKEAAAAAEKAAKAAAREAKRAAKAAAKAAGEKAPAHMKKVDKARSKLPPLCEEAEELFTNVTTNLSIGQISALSQHLAVQARAMSTLRATASPRLPLGATVKITGGEARFIGVTGTVVHSHALRAKVQVPGRDKVVYIYNGEAEVVGA